MKFYILLFVAFVLLLDGEDAELILKEKLPHQQNDRVYLEGYKSFPEVPRGWKALSLADGDDEIQLMFAIKQRNTQKLISTLYSISDPQSPRYSEHLTPDELKSMIAPHSSSVSVVTKWILSNNISSFQVSKFSDWIYVNTSVRVASAILGNITFHVYRYYGSTSFSFIRSYTPYSVPSPVASHLDLVGGVFRLPSVRRFSLSKLQSLLPPREEYPNIDPRVIMSTLNISDVRGSNSSKNIQCVNQFLQEYYSPVDLADFQRRYDLPLQTPKVIGPNDVSAPGGEASLDIEYIMATARDVQTWFVSTDGLHQGQEPFLKWITALSELPAPFPLVNSVSYADAESSLTTTYATRVSLEFAKVGSMGVTLIIASGDSGVGCNADGKQQPYFPASSPHVTAVGGVVLVETMPLSIRSDAISTGGFSNYFTQPPYQSSAVKDYLNNPSVKLPPKSSYNVSGRAIPDVSCYSENLLIQFDGGLTTVGGTSCAAPVFAGVISLVNEARLAKGKKPVGFLNTALYAMNSNNGALLDVVDGPTNENPPCQGFQPAKGWDPITGLGVPNYPGLVKYFSGLP